MIIDIAVGGIIYAVFSLLFNKHFEIWNLGISILITLFPDLDGLLFAAWKFLCFLFGWRFNLIHHKLIHWPLVWTPLFAMSAYFLIREYYWVNLCIVVLGFHFIHDSLPPDPGPQWLFPINTKHYCIDEKGKIVSRTRTEFFEFVRQFWAERGEKGPSTWRELKMALTPTWTGCALLLIAGEINFALWIKG